jgi:2,4-diaminopentanoate dehydrogenase
VRVSIYGAGQVGSAVRDALADQPDMNLLGPLGRADRAAALGQAADAVVIATTSFLAEVAADIREAVAAGSNVITTAEEAAFPWHYDPGLADELDQLARGKGVTILGAGVNPGLAFDALVLTASGAGHCAKSIRVERVVDLSGFGVTVLRRLGIGFSPREFAAGIAAGSITGHIGFPQSMRIVAQRMGVPLGDIERDIQPILAGTCHDLGRMRIQPGQSAGFHQRYTGMAAGRPWFEADFLGHVAPAAAGHYTRDEILITTGDAPLRLTIQPGINPQTGSASMIANSVRRLIEARPGWLTVADLPPACPSWGSGWS